MNNPQLILQSEPLLVKSLRFHTTGQVDAELCIPRTSTNILGTLVGFLRSKKPFAALLKDDQQFEMALHAMTWQADVHDVLSLNLEMMGEKVDYDLASLYPNTLYQYGGIVGWNESFFDVKQNDILVSNRTRRASLTIMREFVWDEDRKYDQVKFFGEFDIISSDEQRIREDDSVEITFGQRIIRDNIVSVNGLTMTCSDPKLESTTYHPGWMEKRYLVGGVLS